MLVNRDPDVGGRLKVLFYGRLQCHLCPAPVPRGGPVRANFYGG